MKEKGRDINYAERRWMLQKEELKIAGLLL